MPTIFLPEVETQLDNAVDEKDNYEESSFVHSKPSWNLSNRDGFRGCLRKRRKCMATTSRQQKTCVDKTQEKQSFTQRIIPSVTTGETLKEDSTKEHAKGLPRQGKTAKPKSKIVYYPPSLSREEVMTRAVLLLNSND